MMEEFKPIYPLVDFKEECNEMIYTTNVRYFRDDKYYLFNITMKSDILYYTSNKEEFINVFHKYCYEVIYLAEPSNNLDVNQTNEHDRLLKLNNGK